MTIYARVDVSGGPLNLDDYRPSLGESVTAAWDEAWATNPTPSLLNMAEMNTATGGLQLVEDVVLPDGTRIAFDDAAQARPVPLDVEVQTQRIKDAGLEGMLQAREGYTQEALDILIAHKREENYRRFVNEKAPAWHTPFAFGTALGASVLDPVNVASAFVPVVGEARLLSMLGKAGSIAGRALVRARTGVLEGAVGAAMVEPLVYAGQAAVQADYGMMDSLLNVGFGAIMGAGLQPLAGGVSDFIRARRGLPQPWAVVEKTDISERLRLDLAERMERALLHAETGADAGQARQNALASAALFDARARAWAYDTGKTVDAYYERHAPEFRSWQAPFDESPDRFLSGDLAPSPDTSLYHAAMYSARESDIREFLARVRQEGPKADKSYYAFAVPGELEGWEVRLPSDVVHHVDRRHKDLTAADMEQLPNVLASLTADTAIDTGTTGQFGRTYVGMAETGGKGYGVSFSVAENGTLYLNTFFRDSPKNLRAWLGQKKEAFMGRAASKTASHKNPRVTHDKPHQKSLKQQLEDVKRRGGTAQRLMQSVDTAPATDSVAFKKWNSADPRIFYQPVSHTSFQTDVNSANARASVEFDAGGKAVITFFSSADLSSAPHELYHIFRRELAETARDPDASPRAREQWAKIEEFVGAEPGQTWTRAMEEKFARAGERFLLEGKAPSNALLDVFTRLRQWFMEIYADADAAGLEISDGMREVFNNMFAVPVEKADQSFRYAVGDLATREFEREFAESGSAVFDDAVARGDVETVQGLVNDSEAGLRETVSLASGSEPELAAAMVEAAAPELAAADEAIARARLHRDVLREVVNCEMRR